MNIWGPVNWIQCLKTYPLTAILMSSGRNYTYLTNWQWLTKHKRLGWVTICLKFYQDKEFYGERTNWGTPFLYLVPFTSRSFYLLQDYFILGTLECGHKENFKRQKQKTSKCSHTHSNFSKYQSSFTIKEGGKIWHKLTAIFSWTEILVRIAWYISTHRRADLKIQREGGREDRRWHWWCRGGYSVPTPLQSCSQTTGNTYGVGREQEWLIGL